MTDNCSPRWIEYGNVTDIKNSLNVIILEGDAIPSPVILDIDTACRIHVVIVSGNVTSSDIFPDNLKKIL